MARTLARLTQGCQSGRCQRGSKTIAAKCRAPQSSGAPLFSNLELAWREKSNHWRDHPWSDLW